MTEASLATTKVHFARYDHPITSSTEKFTQHHYILKTEKLAGKIQDDHLHNQNQDGHHTQTY